MTEEREHRGMTEEREQRNDRGERTHRGMTLKGMQLGAEGVQCSLLDVND
jgi:hypothetical protein